MTQRGGYPRKKVEQLWRTAMREGWSYKEYLTRYWALIQGKQGGRRE